jgi:flagellar basal-body rod protein FlgC
MEAMRISLSGLDVEWQRLQVIAQNLANMNSTRTAEGGVFQPMRLVSGPDTAFGELLRTSSSSLGNPTGVRVVGLEAQVDGLRKTYDPSHPHADTDGFVVQPNIDHAGEMTLMIQTSRAYEANLVAVSIAQSMYAKALDIGRQS